MVGKLINIVPCVLIAALIITSTSAESCRGRCGDHIEFATCQCDSSCLIDDICCPDFWQVCLDIRLVDGRSPNEGRVELMLGSEPVGSICDDGWSIMDATVSCNQLGYPGASLKIAGSVFGSGNHALVASTFLCTGDEKKITDCEFTKTRGFCKTGGAAGVICQKPGYQGCFGRSSSSLLLRDNYLSHPAMTGDRCIQHCGYANFELAAVRGSECTCGLGIPIDSDYYHDYRCRMPCPGDPMQICGGYTEGRLMVYKTTTGFCRHPGDPSNGNRLDDYFRFGSKVRFTCDSGYTLEGNTVIQCVPGDETERPITTLQWSGIAPVCKGNSSSGIDPLDPPGPSKRKGGVINVVISLVVVFLVAVAVLVVLITWRIRRRMNKEPPPPVPASPPTGTYPSSASSDQHAVHENSDVRPVYAMLTPRSDRDAPTGARYPDGTGAGAGENANVNKCTAVAPGASHEYFTTWGGTVTTEAAPPPCPARPPPPAQSGRVFYSTKIKNKKFEYY